MNYTPMYICVMAQLFTEQPNVIDLNPTAKDLSNFQLFREAQFTARDLGISYRELNHWSENDLIDDERNDNGWRKLSFAAFVWVQLIKELRAIGVSLDVIRQAKQSFMKPEKDSGLDLLGAVAVCVSSRKPIFIIISPQINKILFAEEYQSQFCNTRQKPFVTIRLDQLLSQLLPHLNWDVPEEKANSDRLTPAENRAIELVRDGSFSKVSIVTRGGKIDRLETLKTTEKTYQILEQINKVGFGEVTFKKKGGEVIFTETIEVEKFHE